VIRRVVLILVIVVVGGAIAGDQVARAYAQDQIHDRAGAYFGGQARTSAHISSFPFVGRLLASGSIRTTDITMENATLEQLTLRRLRLHLVGIRLDRDQLLHGHVHLIGLQSGTVEVDVDGRSLAERIGRDVRFRPGVVEVHGTVAGRAVVATGTITVRANVLSFHPTGAEGVPLPLVASVLAFTYRLPRSDVFPCAATLQPIKDALRIGCTVTQLPEKLTG